MSKKALVVGINNYSMGPLQCCINDGASITSLLERNGDNSLNFNVKFLTDVESKAELLSHIEALFSGTNIETAFFYFSGHGVKTETGLNGIVVADGSVVYMSEIMHYVNSSRAQNNIIILDSCYSGALGNEDSIDNNPSILNVGTTLMTACDESEYSIENSIIGHGLFTQLLIDGLTGGAADIQGNITPAGIYAYIDRSLGPWEQRPLFKTNINKAAILRTVRPKVSIDILRNIPSYFDTINAEYPLDPSYEFTNTPEEIHQYIRPYATDEHVAVFKELQKLVSIGLVEPVDEEHMYFAAMHNKSCRLTAVGKHYWHLAKENRF